MRRSFRFPVWMIVLMLMILLNVMIAIDKTRTLSIQMAGGESVLSTWSVLPELLVLAVAFLAVAGVVGYGLLCALRKVEAQRLAIRHPSNRNC